MHSNSYRTIPTNLQGAFYPSKHYNYTSLHMLRTSFCVDTYDKNYLSSIPIAQNVVVVVYQQLKANRFLVRNHFELRQQKIFLCSLWTIFHPVIRFFYSNYKCSLDQPCSSCYLCLLFFFLTLAELVIDSPDHHS